MFKKGCHLSCQLGCCFSSRLGSRLFFGVCSAETIQRYLKGKDRVRADEISDALRIDFDLVNELLLELWGEGWVEPER